jgi:hypothetical protein
MIILEGFVKRAVHEETLLERLDCGVGLAGAEAVLHAKDTVGSVSRSTIT